jgi:hypothetical protein
VRVGFTWDEEALLARVIIATGSAARCRKVRHESLTLDQARAVLTAAEGTPLNAYIVLSLPTCVGTEELRALTRDHLDLKAICRPIMAWRSVRLGGKIRTPPSPRVTELVQRKEPHPALTKGESAVAPHLGSSTTRLRLPCHSAEDVREGWK